MTATETIEISSPIIATPTDGRRRPYLDLLLISFLILFFELACIRFFGSMVVFLTFFTNIVLMASFLGMSVGCLAATRRQNFINWVLPLGFGSVLLALAVFAAYQKFGAVMIDVGNQVSPQLIYFGTEYRPRDPAHFVVPIWVVAGVFFALVALMFVGLGQVMGRAFDAIPNRIGAYTTNVLGSLLGIVGFFAASWFGTSPHVWFLVCVAITLYFVTRWTPLQIVAQIGLLFVVALVAYGVGDRGQVFWSPYYKIRYTSQTGEIDTNNISHQQMVNVRTAGPAYMLPHLLNRDAGGKPFNQMLIIGAGSGNDVAAALASGAGHVDAVEIDPVINQLGKQDHPNRPFDDPRVKVWYDDGRSFLHKNHGGPYDIAVYALVDSLVLHSGFTSLRLENFLFTEQAFRDVRAKLKPSGVFAMYNYYRQGWVVDRLVTMAKNVFGMDPIVVSLPYQDQITPTENQGTHITFLIVGVPDASGHNATIDAIRAKFQSGDSFWVNTNPSFNEHVNGYAPTPEALMRSAAQASESAGIASINASSTQPGIWQKIAPATVDTAGVNLYPTDDWPFLYLRSRAIPWMPNGAGVATIAVLSILILLIFAPVRRIQPSGHMFFLGAGFMLLETKGVVHMALLFGSTWIVNSVVFFAILVMILLANLYVIISRTRNLMPIYVLLIAALLVNTFVPMDKFLALSGAARTIVSCGVIFIPIFFAGVIFATSFRDSDQPDIDMGSNIAGIILGGLSESLSMVLGFNYLLGIAVLFYLLSWAMRKKVVAAG
jgi:spermidine synthase